MEPRRLARLLGSRVYRFFEEDLRRRVLFLLPLDDRLRLDREDDAFLLLDRFLPPDDLRPRPPFVSPA